MLAIAEILISVTNVAFILASIAEYTYPRIVWRDREKKLWNPIHKKPLKNRPEERVRLRTIEYLLRAGWSKHRISTEEAIGKIGDTSMRTDIICYNQQFKPKLLVECKAEQVPISAKTAEQVARYNQKVGAPYLLMTNGLSDFWYAISDGVAKAVAQEEVPDSLLETGEKAQFHFEEWKNRGFAGEKAVPDLRKWLEELLPSMWMSTENAENIRYINFSQGPSDVVLNHYYRIRQLEKDRRLALTTLNTAFGGNRLIIILNEENENKAVMEINLDLLFEEKKGNTSVYSEQGIRVFDLNKYWDLTDNPDLGSIVEQSDRLFREHVG